MRLFFRATLLAALGSAALNGATLEAQQRDTLDRPSIAALTMGSAAGSAAGGLVGLMVTAAFCEECRQNLEANVAPYYIATTLGAAGGARLMKLNQVPSVPRALVSAALGLPAGIGLGALAASIDDSVGWVGFVFGQGIVTALVSGRGRPR
jgi:hypothetical protein